MKAHKLIELLQTLPPDAEVHMLVPEGAGTWQETDINAWITHDQVYVHFIPARDGVKGISPSLIRAKLDGCRPIG